MRIYEFIATRLVAIENCRSSNNREWALRHQEAIEEVVKALAPSGSGFDAGTDLVWDKSSPNRLVFSTAYHHMTEGGMYDGWTHHDVTVTPHLAFGASIFVHGPNRNDIKDYVHEVFHSFLFERWSDAKKESSTKEGLDK